MKPYNELTEQGRKRRFHKVIELALREYHLKIEKIEYFLEHTNKFFLLTDSNKDKYVFKIFNDLSTTIEDNMFEIYVMNLILEKTNVKIPEVIYTRNGEGVVTTISKYTPFPVRSTIYKWVKGNYFAGQENESLFYSLGQSIAKIHDATHGIQPPTYFSPKQYDSVFYFKNEKIVYHLSQYQDYFDKEDITILNLLVPYLNKEIYKLYHQNKPQILHGDLHQWNILVDQDIVIIDFEDTVMGLPVQDLSITLFYYELHEKLDFDFVKKAILRGYHSIKPLSLFNEEILQLLMIARRVNLINFFLQLDNYDDYSTYIEKSMHHIHNYVKKIDL